MTEWAIGLLIVAILWALAEWRVALLLCVATAVLQDPIRKVTPDQPAYFILFVGVVFAVACLRAWAGGIPLSPNRLFSQYRNLTLPFSVLLLVIALQAFNAYLRFDNVMLPLLGLVTYLLPVPSIVFAYQLALRGGEFRISQFMKWYVVCIALALTTVALEFSGYDWPIFGQVGNALIIYDRITGAIMTGSAGIFRASEIASWHAMTAACFVVLLGSLRRATFIRLLTALSLVAFFIGVGVMTGRRKILMEFVVFVIAYGGLWLILEKKVGKLAIIGVTAAALMGYIWLAEVLRENVIRQSEGEYDTYSLYVARSQSVFNEAPARFVELGIAPITWAYERFGFLGAGLGVGTQGAQYLGGRGEDAGAAEGGLGKITLELGIPGLLVMGWVGILFVRNLWRIMRAASRHSRRMGRLSFGLCSFLLANLAAFSVATQAYGDLFILLILGWTLGFLLAIPILVEREVRTRQPAIFEKRPPVFRPKPIAAS